MELSVTMETRVQVGSEPNYLAPSLIMLQINLVAIGSPIAEIFVFENVDTHTNRQTTARLVYYDA